MTALPRPEFLETVPLEQAYELGPRHSAIFKPNVGLCQGLMWTTEARHVTTATRHSRYATWWRAVFMSGMTRHLHPRSTRCLSAASTQVPARRMGRDFSHAAGKLDSWSARHASGTGGSTRTRRTEQRSGATSCGHPRPTPTGRATSSTRTCDMSLPATSHWRRERDSCRVAARAARWPEDGSLRQTSESEVWRRERDSNPR